MKYKYMWKNPNSDKELFALSKADIKKTEEFDTEIALSTIHSEACLPNNHEWHQAWVFGVDDCKKCQARRKISR